MAAIAMRHAELIQKLGEFYTLLAQLGSVDPPSLVRIPTPDAPAPIHRAAALAAGYTDEAVGLLGQLPYVSKDPNDWHPQMMPSTEPIDFTKCEKEDDFRFWREYGDGVDDRAEDEDGNEELIPGSVVKLTEIHLYGTFLLYDTETRLLRAWEPLKNPVDPVEIIGYAHVPAQRPSEVLDPWVDGYRSFRYMHTPGEVHWDRASDGHLARTEPPEHYQPGAKAHWWAKRAVEQARMGLKDLYLECGWDVTSRTQDGFDRAKFIEMRAKYMDDVVQPLEERADAVHKEWHKRDEL